MQRLDIYGDRKKSFARELVLLEKLETSARNKAILTKWHNRLFATGSGEIRVAKLNSQMRKVILWLQKDLDTIQKEDVEGLMAFISRESSWSDATKADYRRAIKQFFTWFEEEDPRLQEGDAGARRVYEYVRKYIRRSYQLRKPDYSTIITEEDLRAVLEKGCKNAKERAFLAVLHEGGFRAGEYLNIRLLDLEIKDNRVIIQVDGKTGQRRVPLVISMGILVRWLDEHPFKDNQQAFLWLGESHTHMHQPLQHIGALKLVDRCFERAGVNKRHNLHWFRHSAATIKAPYLREVMLCKLFGWAIGSKQVRTYVHADVSQVEDAVLGMYGLEKRQEKKNEPVKCLGCMLMNPAETRYCQRCGRPLTTEVIMADANAKNSVIDEAMDLYALISMDNDLKKRFLAFCNQVRVTSSTSDSKSKSG